MTWLLGAPQFWYGFVVCAALIFLALLPRVLFPRRKVIIYSIPERAPIPLFDPFYKLGAENHVSDRQGTSLREHREKLKEARSPYNKRRSSQPTHIKEARKRAVWHPHPDDSLPVWDRW